MAPTFRQGYVRGRLYRENFFFLTFHVNIFLSWGINEQHAQKIIDILCHSVEKKFWILARKPSHKVEVPFNYLNEYHLVGGCVLSCVNTAFWNLSESTKFLFEFVGLEQSKLKFSYLFEFFETSRRHIWMSPKFWTSGWCKPSSKSPKLTNGLRTQPRITMPSLKSFKYRYFEKRVCRFLRDDRLSPRC